jgi:CheY-like chemotaxis protein
MYSAEDLRSMNIVDLVAGADDELMNVLRKNVSDRRYTMLEAVCVRADETRFHADIVVNRIKVKGSVNLAFFIRDVTDRKQAEEELKRANEKLLEAERLQARIDTLATLFHELNNPMQILMCMAELDNNAEYKKQVHRILSVLAQLRKEDSLEPIVDETGNARYSISVEKDIEDCDPKKLLVVDDEDILRKMFVSAISSAVPYLDIDAASDGKEAVRLFTKHHYGLVIMDVAMPEMGGEDAFREIEIICEKKGWKMPGIIFCTGFVISDNLQTVIGDGAIHTCLKKPLSMTDLVGAVQNRLAQNTIA